MSASGATTRVSPPGAVYAALLFIGLTAVIAQIVLMRELMVVFYGNELSLGLMLANWLLWTAAGSGLLGRLNLGSRDPRILTAALQTANAAVFPLTLLAVRASKLLLQPVAGELLGPGRMLLVTFALMGPFCALSGWLFAAGSRMYARLEAVPAAAATARVYFFEAVGSGAGGLLASLALIPYLGAFRIAFLLAALNLLVAAALLLPRRARSFAWAAVALGLLAAPAGARRLEEMSLGWLWRGLGLLEVRNSAYGNLAVVETEGARTLYENGLASGAVPDPAAAEEAVHYALLQHPAPHRLLLIGGGWNGSLMEALRHPTLRQVDYTELDPAVLDLAAARFAETWQAARNDPRVRVHARDGRQWLKTAPHGFDVIIVNLPEPATAQLNRFYTVEFFRQAASKLRTGGVLALRLRASENYVSPQRARLLASIRRTLAEVFAEVAVLPGETVHLFASNRAGILVRDAESLLERLRDRGIQTRYVREYYFRFLLTPLRVQALEQQIAGDRTTPLNRDFTPIAYYFDAVLWGAQFDTRFRDLFETVARLGFTPLAAGAAALLSIVAVLASRRGPQAVAGLAVGAMGFTLIALEVLLLIGFQVLYGYVYHQLAVLIGAFMAGMALGSRRALSAQPPSDPARLAALGALVAAAAPALYAVFQALGAIPAGAALWAAGHLLFPALAAACGCIGGYQFPVASRVFFGRPTNPGLGALYALDLAGACLGAILVSAYLLPVFGFLRTAVLLAILNLLPALAALGKDRKYQGQYTQSPICPSGNRI